MPPKTYKRYKPKRRRRTTRKAATPWYAKGYSVQWLTSELWKLKGLINSEKYKLDVNDSGTAILNDGVYSVHLTAVAQGDGDAQRTGNSIYVRSINVKGSIQWATAGLANQFVRLMVIQDTQQIGDAYPALTSVLQNVGGSNSYNQHLSTSTVGRFKILYTRTFQLDNVNDPAYQFQINLPMRHHVRFNGANATDIQRGGIYIMAISSSAADGPLLTYSSRCSYHDN